MAAIDFPSNPVNGDTFSPPGLDTVYTYFNGVWTGGVGNADEFMPLDGGDFTGNVTFGTDKITLTTAGNADFAGDVVIDGNLALGTISNVEAAIVAASGGTPNAISDGSATLNFNGSSVLQSNTGYQPTLTNSYDLGSASLNWNNLYVNAVNVSSDNILLNSDGSAVFGGFLQTNNYLYVSRQGASGATTIAQFGTDTDTSQILFAANGNATFVGDVTTSKRILAGSNGFSSTGVSLNSSVGAIYIRPPATTDVALQVYSGTGGTSNDVEFQVIGDGSVKIGGASASDANIALNADGSGSFAANVTSDGVFISDRTSNSSRCFIGSKDGNENFVVTAGGDVTALSVATSEVSATGNLNLKAGGTGTLKLFTQNSNAGYSFYKTDGTTAGVLRFSQLSQNRNYTLPDASGTVALTQDIPAAPGDGQINVNAGVGLTATGDNATANQTGNTTRVIAMPNTGVTQGTYTYATVTVDQQGRITSASDGTPPSTPGDGALTVKLYNQSSASQVGTFTANQSSGSTITLPQVDYDQLSNKPTIPASANNGQINFNAGNGLAQSGSNATADQANDTTKTFSVQADGSTITVGANGIKVASAPELSTSHTIFGQNFNGSADVTGAMTDVTTLVTSKRVSQSIVTIPDGAWSLQDSNLWQTSTSTLVNPSEATPGQSGVIFSSGTITGWGSYFKFSGGEAPTIPANSVIPYYVKTQNEILIGNATEEFS